MQPVLTQVPPNSLRSTTATRMPASASRAASGGPACPVPMMMASNFCMVTARSFCNLRLKGLKFGSSGGRRVERPRPVENNAFQRIELALPRRRRDCPLRIDISGFPARADARRAEVDVLGVILVGEPRRQQLNHVHPGHASVAGQFAHFRRFARFLRDVREQLRDDVAQTVDLALANDMTGDAAGILDGLLAVPDF